MLEKTTSYADQIKELAIQYAGPIVWAIVVLIIVWILINQIMRFVSRRMEKGNVDDTLRPFLNSFIKITLRIILLIAVASMIGIQMTSFIAILGAAGLAIGLALQGSLSNFAGGVIILLLK